MSNQVILWGTLIIPWLTLLFMPKEDIKRYISVGLLSAILSIIALNTGISNMWWAIRENIYPFVGVHPFFFSLFIILPMWLIKYTYGRFWLYLTVDTIINAVYAFAGLPWLGTRGIIDFNSSLIAFIFASIISVILYKFQIWQEGIYVRSERNGFSPNLQPAAAKPLTKDQKDNEDE
ncbi:MAG: hypothetical protein H6Q71_3 [Firmicutes bacterium]|nr:hypothetical protein [Bacillota bacterium]